MFFQRTVDAQSPRRLLSVAVCVNLHVIIQPLHSVQWDAGADVNVPWTDRSDRVITVWPRRSAQVGGIYFVCAFFYKFIQLQYETLNKKKQYLSFVLKRAKKISKVNANLTIYISIFIYIIHSVYFVYIVRKIWVSVILICCCVFK